MQDKDIVEVCLAVNTAEAYLIKSLLEDNSIPAKIIDEAMYGAGVMPFHPSAGPRVWVSRSDSERAKQIIDQREIDRRIRESNPSIGSWVCPHCGEKVQNDFDICWNCEHSRIPT